MSPAPPKKAVSMPVKKKELPLGPMPLVEDAKKSSVPALVITNAKWNNPQQTSLDCDASFNGGPALPFTATDNSGDAAVQGVWATATSGAVAPYSAPTPPALTPTQQADAALAAGIPIISTGTPSLNGTYTLSQYAQLNILSEVGSIILNGTFTNGQATMDYLDAAGESHIFTIAQFKDFATKFGIYTSALTLYALTNGANGSIPTSPVTIA